MSETRKLYNIFHTITVTLAKMNSNMVEGQNTEF